MLYDTSAPRVINQTPTGATTATQPLVSGLFATDDGAAVDVSQVRILRPGGVDVTAASVISATGFSYLPNPPLLTGLNSFRIELADVAGNVGAFAWSFTVDRATGVQILHPTTGSLLNTPSQPISGQAEANASLSLFVNGSAVGNATADGSGNYGFPPQLLPDNAPSELVVHAVDTLGNRAVATATVFVNSSQPAASLSVAPNPFVIQTHFGLSASPPISASVAGWHLLVESQVISHGIGLPPASLTWRGVGPDGQPVADGEYATMLVVTATNGAAANVSGPQLVRDRTMPPPPLILYPLNGALTIEPSTLVSGTAEPHAAVTVFNNGLFTFTTPADANGAWQLAYPLEGGWNRLTATATDGAGNVSASSAFSNTVTVTATDRAGNVTVRPLHIVRDAVPPAVMLAVTPRGLLAQIVWQVEDGFSGVTGCVVEASTDSVNWTPLANACSGQLRYAGGVGVEYAVRVRAQDGVGNLAQPVAAVAVDDVVKYYYAGAERNAMQRGDALLYLHGDHLGSTSLTTDVEGETVYAARYLPYGESR